MTLKKQPRLVASRGRAERVKRPGTWLEQELSMLPPGPVWSVDQVDRCIWLLAAGRFFERYALLGAWVEHKERFCVVLRHPEAGAIGLVTTRSSTDTVDHAGVSEAVHATVAQIERLDVLSPAWLSRGWQHDGVLWNSEPDGPTTPWGRVPQPGDDPVDSTSRDRGLVDTGIGGAGPADNAALHDLHHHVEGATWAETTLPRLVTSTVAARSRTRFVAVWVVAPDCIAEIEVHVWPPPGNTGVECDEDVLRKSLLPGQAYLRFGQYHLHSMTWRQHALFSQAVLKELDTVHGYPVNDLVGRTLDHGVARVIDQGVTEPGMTRMAKLARVALDRLE